MYERILSTETARVYAINPKFWQLKLAKHFKKRDVAIIGEYLGDGNRSYRRVGEKHGISPERVRQIIHKAFRTIRRIQVRNKNLLELIKIYMDEQKLELFKENPEKYLPWIKAHFSKHHAAMIIGIVKNGRTPESVATTLHVTPERVNAVITDILDQMPVDIPEAPKAPEAEVVEEKKEEQPVSVAGRPLKYNAEIFNEIKEQHHRGEILVEIAAIIKKKFGTDIPTSTVGEMIAVNSVEEYYERKREEQRKYHARRQEERKKGQSQAPATQSSRLPESWKKLKDFRERLDEVLMDVIIDEVAVTQHQVIQRARAIERENAELKKRVEELETENKKLKELDFTEKLRLKMEAAKPKETYEEKGGDEDGDENN